MGNHSTDSGKDVRNPVKPIKAATFGGPGSTKLGNEVALNVGGGGPGAGRTRYGQGGRKRNMAKSIPASQLRLGTSSENSEVTAQSSVRGNSNMSKNENDRPGSEEIALTRMFRSRGPTAEELAIQAGISATMRDVITRDARHNPECPFPSGQRYFRLGHSELRRWMAGRTRSPPSAAGPRRD